jgi:drug/metabolite transporter (DMT)-like permease
VSLIVILLLSVLMNAVAQVSLKRGMTTLQAGNIRTSPGPASLVYMLTNPFVVIWLALLMPSMLLWLKALSMTDLSFAYPFQSLSLVCISLGSVVFLKERVTARQWTGIVLILLGIVLISGS